MTSAPDSSTNDTPPEDSTPPEDVVAKPSPETSPPEEPKEETAEPSNDNGTSTTVEPIAEKVESPTEETTPEPAKEPATEATGKPTVDAPATTEEPAPEPAKEPATEATEKPTVDAPATTEEPAPEPAKEPATEATEKPTVDAPATTEESTTETAEEPAAEKAPAKAPKDASDKPAAKPKKKKKKKEGPDPAHIIATIGTTSEAALKYVSNPDAKLSRMARKHREAVISEVPPVTAGALLGPEALCRHFIASAAAGRYNDLFYLWDLFKAFPEECKPVLAARQRAQERAKQKLKTATLLGLMGDATRVATDIDRASGLPWRWLKEILDPLHDMIAERPVVLAALARRDDGFTVTVPETPSDRWLGEAVRLKESGAEIPGPINAALATHADRLPATVKTLTMAQDQYPDQVPALIERVDLDAPDVQAILAWARDHDHHARLEERIFERVQTTATTDRAEGLHEWTLWRDRGVTVEMPEELTAPTLDGLDLGRPETAELIKVLRDDQKMNIDPQEVLDRIANENRMLGEKAYESFVCTGFEDIHLPIALEGNPVVRTQTRCPACQAWTWVRPGHETRCPQIDTSAAVGIEEDPVAAIDAAVDQLVPAEVHNTASATIETAARPADTAPPVETSKTAERPADAPVADVPDVAEETATSTETTTQEEKTADDPVESEPDPDEK